MPVKSFLYCFTRRDFTSTAAFALAICVLGTGLAHADTISIRADEWAPINSDPRLADQGVMIDIAKAIAADNGHTIDYRILSWDDALLSAKEGKIDCVVGANSSEAQENGLLTPKKPWVVSRQTAYAKADRKISILRVEDFANYRIGVSEGYSYGDEIDNYVELNRKDPKKVYVTESQRPLRDLLLRLNVGQLDIAVETNVVMDYNLKTTGLQGRIVNSGTPTKNKEELFIACSPKRSNTGNNLKMFDAGMAKLRASGQMQEILSKYSVKDWE